MKILALITLLFLLSCGTTVGFHDDELRNSIDFGEVQEFKVCILHEKTVSSEEVNELEIAWKKELLLYNIDLKFTYKIPVDRYGFWAGEILEELYKIKLNENCDRIFYFVGREWSDIGFESLMIGLAFITGLKFEIQGAVESTTNTRGYIKAKYISLLQMIFTSPQSTLIHEGYHIMGCPHALWKDECYKIIKNAKMKNRKNESENKIFSVKSLSENSKDFYDFEQVNHYLGSRSDLK